MLRPRHSSWLNSSRRICVGLMLVSYLLTVTGFPVRASTSKHGGQPFPCQDHDCGCVSAEQCWTNCCCFSREQHVVWAKEHNVQPPAYALLSDPEPADADKPACAHCRESKVDDVADASDHDHHSTGSVDHCCQKHQGSTNLETHEQPAGKIRWLVSVNALNCRGLSTVWVAVGSIAPPPSPLAWVAYAPLAGRLIDDRISPPYHNAHPVDPPPRCLNAV